MLCWFGGLSDLLGKDVSVGLGGCQFGLGGCQVGLGRYGVGRGRYVGECD